MSYVLSDGNHRRLSTAFARCFLFVLSSSQVVDSMLRHALVKGTEGYIAGEVVPEAAIFWGIPFSQPPVGEWRWRRPRNPTPYESNLWNATYARPGCMQICDPSLKNYICAPTMSEDCLYLNIWIPRRVLQVSEKNKLLSERHYTIRERFTKKDSESLAVMLYLHGGNFIMGSGSAVLYDGRFLANKGDVIVVTTNYRLGAFGFLALDGMKDVNFGIWDQIQALIWARSNIASFGGNPDKITVVGQSAGAESIGILLASAYGKGLFQQAVIQSNPWSLPYRNLREAHTFGDKLVERLLCQPSNMTCLRSTSANEVLNAAGDLGGLSLKGQRKVLVVFQMWGPVIDEDLILQLPISSFLQGEFREMPLIIGTDRDDGYIFIMGAFTHPISKLIYDVILNFIGGKLGTSVSDEYPSHSLEDNREQLSKIATDYAFTCPSRRVAFQMGNNTWSYRFNAKLPWKRIYEKYNCIEKVCHGSELPYLFGTVSLTDLKAFDKYEIALSDSMQRYWTNFVKYGNPNGKADMLETSIEHWERFTNGRGKSYEVLQLNKKDSIMLQNASCEKCDFWDDLRAYGKY